MKNILIIIAVLMLSACATTYKTEGFGGGYSETRLDENVFVVTFRGNAWISKEKVANYTLLRGAELALEHGYKYFVVTDKEAYVKMDIVRTTEGGLTTYNKPRENNTIVLLKTRPENVFSYNVAFIYKSITQKYGIKPKTE